MAFLRERVCPTCGGRYGEGVRFCPADGAPTATEQDQGAGGDPHVGGVLGGKYRLVRVLGRGGMGTVYEAHHVRLQKRFAVKLINSDLSSFPGAVERFQREAQITASIRHPHVVDIVDYDVAPDGTLYMVSEYIDGPTLRAKLRDGPLPPRYALRCALQVARGLQDAHGKGIVHRDLKPENVLVEEAADGRPRAKIVDFGVSKLIAGATHLTRTGMIMGTPCYMSPEQARGQTDIDARADLFSLGSILYEMLAGRVPFDADNPAIVLYKVLHEEPEPLLPLLPEGVPPQVAGVVHRLLAKDPDQRYASARELVLALKDACSASTDLTAEMTGQTSVPPAGAEPAGAIEDDDEDDILAPPPVKHLTPTFPSAAEVVEAPAAASTPMAWPDEGELPPSRRGRWVVFALGATALAASVSWYAVSRPPADAERGRAGVAVPPVPAVPVGGHAVAVPADESRGPAAGPTAEPLLAAPASVMLRLLSDPEGAAVLRGDERLCTAPCAHEVAADALPLRLRFALDGYRDEEREVASAEDATVRVALKPAPRRDRTRGSRSSRSRGREQPPSEAMPNPF